MNVNLGAAWRQAQALVNQIVASLPNLLLAFVVFILFLVISRYAAALVKNIIIRAHQTRGVAVLVGRVVAYAVGILGVLVAISIVFPTFKANDLIQVLGIGGVAVGFAFKDIFQNFLAGIIILVSRPFSIGDQIVVKDLEGTVEDIQTRATMIRTYDNKRIVVPNITLYSENVTVLTGYSKRRSEYDLGIAFDADIDAARDALLRAVASVEDCEKDPAPEVLTYDFAPSWITMRLRWWIHSSGNVLLIRNQVLQAAKRELEQAGVKMPLPAQTVFLREDDGIAEDRAS